jgi:hypothetical protein
MSFIKSFEVFGERVDILVDSKTSGGASTTLIQHVAPGGGPSPHTHTREDETFTLLRVTSISSAKASGLRSRAAR